MKIFLGKKVTQEDKEKHNADAKEHNEMFTSWVAPFYKDRVIEATKRGWKMNVGMSHFWLEGWAGLRVMLGGDVYDGERWLHLSVSRKTRLPAWGEFTKVKNLFLGEETLAIQVFAPVSQWVNLHPYVLHLYSNFDKPGFLPDFRTIDPVTGQVGI